MRLCELQEKEVINVCDGRCLGNIIDLEFDTESGCVESIIVPGPCKLFGIFGHEFEYCIPWKCIVCIGSDTVLVKAKIDEMKKKL